MISKTKVYWTFFDSKDAKGSEHLQWTVGKVEDVVPTGKWRFTKTDGKSKPNEEMSVEVTYTQVTTGKIYLKKKEPFLKFFAKTVEYSDELKVKEKNRICWVNEYHVEFRTITTHECFGGM